MEENTRLPVDGSGQQNLLNGLRLLLRVLLQVSLLGALVHGGCLRAGGHVLSRELLQIRLLLDGVERQAGIPRRRDVL